MLPLILYSAVPTLKCTMSKVSQQGMATGRPCQLILHSSMVDKGQLSVGERTTPVSSNLSPLIPHLSANKLLKANKSVRRSALRAQETYRTVDSRMAQESLRRYVLRVLRVWRSWFIFSDDYINGLQVPLGVLIALCGIHDRHTTRH